MGREWRLKVPLCSARLLSHTTDLLGTQATWYSVVVALLAGPSAEGSPVVLQKVASELHPKVRNHGEGPY